MSVDPKYIINLQGRDFVKYEGLLDLAHQMGLVGIRTKLLQYPTADNGGLAVVIAEATMPDGREFTGIGDAGPINLKPMMVPHAIRFAETRAKARALRDATNVGMTAYDELTDEDDVRPRGQSPSPAKPAQSTRGTAQVSADQALASFGGQDNQPPAPAEKSMERRIHESLMATLGEIAKSVEGATTDDGKRAIAAYKASKGIASWNNMKPIAKKDLAEALKQNPLPFRKHVVAARDARKAQDPISA